MDPKVCGDLSVERRRRRSTGFGSGRWPENQINRKKAENREQHEHVVLLLCKLTKISNKGKQKEHIGLDYIQLHLC